MSPLSTTNPREEPPMTTTLQALDWPKLLATPMTRWYLEREPWEEFSECIYTHCAEMPAAYAEYQVCPLPGDTSNPNFRNRGELVCSKHLPALIEFATGEPLVADTVVEVGVDPAFLRLTGVDPAFVEAEFNEAAMGCGQ